MYVSIKCLCSQCFKRAQAVAKARAAEVSRAKALAAENARAAAARRSWRFRLLPGQRQPRSRLLPRTRSEKVPTVTEKKLVLSTLSL